MVAFIVQTADAIIYNGEMDTTRMTIKVIDIELKSRKKEGKKNIYIYIYYLNLITVGSNALLEW